MKKIIGILMLIVFALALISSVAYKVGWITSLLIFAGSILVTAFVVFAVYLINGD